MFFLLFGTVWFWVALAVFIAALFIAEACESGIASLVIFLAGVASLHFFGDVNVLSLLRDNVGLLFAAALGYLVFGVIWGGFKWYLFVTDAAEEYQEEKEKFFKDALRPVGKLSVPSEEEVEANWKERVKDRDRYPPKVKENKARITRWMMCWVTSVLWTLCNDFVRGVYRRILQMVTGVFQNISNHAFAKFKADFE